MTTHAVPGGRRLASSSVQVILAQGLAAGLGYLFWMVVTRWASLDVTGLASAAISLAGSTSMLSITGIAYSRLPGASAAAPEARDGRTALAVSAALSGLASLVVLLALPWFAPELAGAGWSTRLAIVAVTLLTAVSSVIDYVAIAATRSGLVLRRNASASFLRLLLVAVVVFALRQQLAEEVVIWAWAGSLAIALLPVAWLLRHDLASRRPDDPGLALRLRRALPTWLNNHGVNVGGVAAPWLLPVIVLSLLGPTDAGVFYPTWMLGSMFFMISPAITGAMLSAEASDADAERRALAGAAKLTAVLLVVPLLVCLVFPGPLLGLFGSDYAVRGSALLRVLALSALPDAVANLLVALLRTRRRYRGAMVANVGGTVVTLVLAVALMPRWGIVGAGIGWLVGQVLRAALATGFVVVGRGRLGKGMA